MKRFFTIVLLLSLTAAIPGIHAEEGMWTYDNLPIKDIKEKYGFEPTKEWLDHARLSSVRFNDGGSGSFISPNGLVMTNHHVAVFQIQKLSTPENNYVDKGFLANSYDEELKCADLELNVLMSMENITDRVRSAEKDDMSPSEKLKAVKDEVAKIQKEEKEATGLRCDVVNLYQGGEYWVYRYKKYTDIRLVMAPERMAAYFGGDYDNFTYPRWDLDMTFFRVYEDDKPIKSENYFKWSKNGAKENELVFVTGHPGSTSRLYTHAELLNDRDESMPRNLDLIDYFIKTLKDYSAGGEEQARRALTTLFYLANSTKARGGMYEGLQDEAIMKKHLDEEKALISKIKANPEWNKLYGNAWDNIAKIINDNKEFSLKHFYRGIIVYRATSLLGKALSFVRYAKEIEKPDMERRNGYHDTQIEGLKFSLLSPAPIFKDLEEAKLAAFLKFVIEKSGKDNVVEMFLQGKSPDKAAHALIANTKMNDVNYRKELWDLDPDEILESDDPFIKLAIKLDPVLEADKDYYDNNIAGQLKEESVKIAKARFAVYGKSIYPDANFTLRLSYGSIKGYKMNGTLAPYKTTLYGLYDRALSFDKAEDFNPPQRYWDKQNKLDLATPVNQVSTNDIIGGNSGSPLINKNAEVVGLVFDGNIESLPGRYIYDMEANRTVSVHSSYIIEALRKLYDANKLADEIQGK